MSLVARHRCLVNEHENNGGSRPRRRRKLSGRTRGKRSSGVLKAVELRAHPRVCVIVNVRAAGIHRTAASVSINSADFRSHVAL
jgi:hypothetical protein